MPHCDVSGERAYDSDTRAHSNCHVGQMFVELISGFGTAYLHQTTSKVANRMRTRPHRITVAQKQAPGTFRYHTLYHTPSLRRRTIQPRYGHFSFGNDVLP